MADSVIRFLFRGDPKGAVQALKQVDLAAGSLDGKFRAVSQATLGLNLGLKEVSGVAVGAAATMATIKMVRFVSGGLEAADAMAKLSRRLAVTTEDIAAYNRAAELSGATQQGLSPWARGNHDRNGAALGEQGSIPVGTGEPATAAAGGRR